MASSLPAYGLAFTALAVAGFAVWDARQQRQKVTYVPVIVERDAAGHRIASGVLDGPRPLTDAQISKRLLTWLRDTRMVVADFAGMRVLVSDAYDLTAPNSSAQQKLIAYHQADPPEVRATHYTVYLSGETALRVDDRTWQLEWCEHKVARDGSPISDDPWRLTATYKIDPPITRADIDRNPEGLFVNDFDWDKPSEQGSSCQTSFPAAQP